MKHELPALPYAFDALEPHIDAKTMEIHHGKHHAAYVNNLNAALEKHPELQSKPVEELIGDLSKVALVDKASVVLVLLFAVAFLGERPSGRDWIGILLVLSGLGLLVMRR